MKKQALFIIFLLISGEYIFAQSRMPADPNAYLCDTRNAFDGDQDYFQSVFFEVPDTITSTIYFAVYHPGATIAYPDNNAAAPGTISRFNLFGGPGCYSDPKARALTQAGDPYKYLGNMIDIRWNNSAGWNPTGWSYFTGVSPSQGEHIGNKYYFRITVEVIAAGAGYYNAFQLDVSYNNNGTPTGISGVRSFAYVLGLAFYNGGGRSYSFYPFVPDNATGNIQAYNFDFDNANTGTMYDYNNISQGTINASASGTTASTAFPIGAAQKNTTWKAVYTEGAGAAAIDCAEIWFKNSATGELYPIYSSPGSPPEPNHVLMTFYKQVYNPPTGYNAFSSDGIAIANNTDTLTINFQVAGADNTPLPVSRNIYVTVNNNAAITTVNSGSTNNGINAQIITDGSGFGYLTIKKPAPAGYVDIAAYWDGYGGSNAFGSCSSAYLTANFVTNNTPSISSRESRTFNTGTGSLGISVIKLTDAMITPCFNTAAGQYLRIRIPASLDCVWDNALIPNISYFYATPTYGATGTKTYLDSKTLQIQITSDFIPNASDPSGFNISNLAFINRNSASSGRLELSWDNGATYQALDDKTYTIIDLTPFITSGETADLDNDGYLDAIHIIYNKNIKDTSIAAGATGFTITNVSAPAFSSTTNGDTADDNDIYITFTDGVLASDATPVLSYDTDIAGADVTDNDGTPNALPDQGPKTPLDKAGPALLSARTVTVNTVELTFSEAMNDATISGNDFTFSGFLAGNGTGAGFNTGTVQNDNIVLVTLSASIGPAETGFLRFTNAGVAGDVTGNMNSQTSTVGIVSGINTIPMILNLETEDMNSDGFIDRIKLVFNKNMRDSTFGSISNFSVAGGNITGFASGTASNDTGMYLTITDGNLNSGSTPDISYTAGSVTDNDGVPNALPNQPARPALDKAGPAIISARTYSVTQVEVTFSEAVDDTSIWGGDFTFSGFVTAGANTQGTGFSTGVTANDNKVLIILAAAITADETGQVKYTYPGSIKDRAGNMNTQNTNIGISDGIVNTPALLYAVTADMNYNGFIDRIIMTFNKDMQDSSFTDTNSFQVSMGASVVSFSTGTANDSSMSLVLTDGVLNTGAAPTVQYSPGSVTDTTLTGLPLQSAQAVSDKAGPAIISARTITINTVEITLSENINDATVSGMDFVFGIFSTPAANGTGTAFDTGSAVNDNLVVITLPGSLTDIAYTGTVKFSGVNVIKDSADNSSSQILPITVTAGIPASPTIIAAETCDFNSNGYLDAVHIFFNTNINDSTVSSAISASKFTLPGTSGLTFTPATNGDTANDTDIYFTFNDNVLKTDQKPDISYDGSGGVLKDMSTNVMASQGPVIPVDKTGPAIISAKTISVNTVQVILSENVSDASVTGSDFTFSGYTTVGANGQGIGFSTGTSADDNTIIITLPASIGTMETGNIRLINNGYVMDTAGNGNSQTAFIPVTDGTPPVVTNVAAVNANGNFGIGSSIIIRIVFSENVTVAGGTPVVNLETGTVDRTSNYTGGSGTNTLSFSYTVLSGDSNPDLDYVSTVSFSGSGAMIRDVSANDAILTLPAPGATGSLGANKDLNVDGVLPILNPVAIVSANSNSALAKSGDTVTVSFTASEGLSALPTVTISGKAATVTDTGSNTYTAAYTMQGTDAEGVIPFTINFTDAAGNAGSQVTVTTDTSIVTLDRTRPLISGNTLETANAYVDIQLSEGAYHTGGTPLAAGDFTLTFLQNSGNATACVIAVLTDNSDNPLAGGENVIRIWMTITGIPNGLETITAAPANGSSVYDAAGNAMAGSQTTGSISLHPSKITMLSRETEDANGDGYIDRIKITTLQNLNDNFTGLDIQVSGYARNAVTPYWSDIANDKIFYINLVQGTVFDTSATPAVQVLVGGSLKSQDNLYAMGPEASAVTSTDKASPLIAVTLAAVGGTRIYIEFTEPVYTDAGHTASLTSADFNYATTGVVAIQSVGAGISSAFLTRGTVFMAENLVTDTLAAVSNGIFDGAGNPMGTTAHPVSNLYLGVVTPLWSSDGEHGAPPLYTGALTVFDGTGRMLDRNILLQARINAAGILVQDLRLYFDANVPSAFKPHGYWLPAAIAGLVSQADTEARPIDQDPSSLPPDPLRNFTFDGSDSEIIEGNEIEFIFNINGKYALQVTDPNDPRTIKPYSFKVAGIRPQNGGVTILSNVIKPQLGEKAKLLYTVTSAGQVTITVFTLNGDVVDILYRGYQGTGAYSVTWNGKSRGKCPVVRGIYFIKIVASGTEEIRKVLVVK